MKNGVKHLWFLLVLVILLYAMYSLIIRLAVPVLNPSTNTLKDMVGKAFIAMLFAAGIIVYLNYTKND